ncbi:MAG: hypothetical protein GWP91_17830 [Rhodobacterales bacterium]|nr:hypothetical protein [Rhodobacterales bacterium]
MTRFYAGTLVIGFVLGCSGLLGFGEEQGRASIQSRQPFTVSFTTKSPDAHHTWFDTDLEAKKDYQVTGRMAFGKKKWKVKLDKSGSPVIGGGNRTTLYWSETNLRTSQVSGTIFAAEIPAVPVGTKIDLKGTLTLTPGTTGTVDVVVTD